MTRSNDSQHRRLLDLLAGWVWHLHGCAESEEPHPGVTREEYVAEAEVIHALYQAVAREEDLDDEGLSAALLTIRNILRTGEA